MKQPVIQVLIEADEDKRSVLRADSEAKLGKTLQPLRNFLRGAAQCRGRISGAALKMRRTVRDAEAAELLEFALALPLVLVMVVGLLDFANAYHLKQALANAAREGARLGASEGTIDITNASPPSVQTIHDDVYAYLQNAGVDTSFIGSTMTSAGNFTWTYYSSGSYGLKIERWVEVPSGDTSGTNLPSTRVTLTYPYDWTFGFNHVITLLIPSSSAAGTVDIEADAMMQNQ